MKIDRIIIGITNFDMIRYNQIHSFIDFDACVMNCVEYNLMFSDCTDYYIASPESEPGYGQD